MDARSLMSLMAIDHIINSTAKSNYMSAGQISVPIIFRGPNDAVAGVGAQHSQLRWDELNPDERRNFASVAVDLLSEITNSDLITSSDKFIVLSPVQLYVFQIARREGLSLWQELFPTLVSISNKGPAQFSIIWAETTVARAFVLSGLSGEYYGLSGFWIANRKM
ncbi:Pyruvate dehydrogenase E1 component subunit beta-1, mitochondrial [Capsicum baccatum]|uniref:Pyruvate dehydrogenase E1 component subunit beta n=1 Tax=Capsicum baccatum TaxID=33114 RepID=A0A2G2VM14_CAPBA|nr:Pyruvate dehydrogenase E1 component subunit beta-1, mitochondrial [Capsicum baccatum]